MANPFNKKTWQNRLSEYPTRRQLVDVDTGNTQTVDVTRSEGQIYNTGDGFTQANMNDLENRIYNAFEDFDGIAAATHTIPRVVPKDITQYYNDGTLGDRLAGRDGFSLYEDIFVGDYFQLSRPITVDSDIENIRNNVGCNHVMIMSLHANRYSNVGNTFSKLTLCPCIVDTEGYPHLGHFGACRLDESWEHFLQNGYEGSSLRAKLGNGDEQASIEQGATITQQLKYEFGSNLLPIVDSYVVSGYDSDGNIQFSPKTGQSAYPIVDTLMDCEVIGYPLQKSFQLPSKLNYFESVANIRETLDDKTYYPWVYKNESSYSSIPDTVIYPYITPGMMQNSKNVIALNVKKLQIDRINLTSASLMMNTLVTPIFTIFE